MHQKCIWICKSTMDKQLIKRSTKIILQSIFSCLISSECVCQCQFDSVDVVFPSSKMQSKLCDKERCELTSVPVAHIGFIQLISGRFHIAFNINHNPYIVTCVEDLNGPNSHVRTIHSSCQACTNLSFNGTKEA